MMSNNCPEFTAEDLNLLVSLARKSDYYAKALKFVKDFGDEKIKCCDMNEKQIKWLWGIKADLKSQEEESV